MSKLLDFLRPQASANSNDERWWGGGNGGSEAGVAVTADTALTLSTFWACTRFLSETIGSLPFVIYRRRDDGGRERAAGHPLYRVLHDRPNAWQTPIEFISMMQGHVLLRGNAYALIVPGALGAVDQLIPLHPDRVTVDVLEGGRLRYKVDQQTVYTQEQIFHLRGMSSDGVLGLSVIEYARNSVGLTMAAERYGARWFRNDSRPGGVLKTDRKLSKGMPERMKSKWRATQAGIHRGDIAILEEGLEFQAIGIPPEEAQFLQTREHQALDVCRWFGIGPHMVGVPGGVTAWGSGLEQIGRGTVTYTLRPWLVRWEQAINRHLIVANNVYYAEFVVEGLLRGDIQARYAAYATGRQWGWLSVNEIRRLENLNGVEGGDVYLQPMNMTPAGEEPAPMSAGGHLPHYEALAAAAAGRLVRKETAAVAKLKARGGDWRAAVAEFYAGHGELVAGTMQVDILTARGYCVARALAVGREQDSEAEAVNWLVLLATDGVAMGQG